MEQIEVTTMAIREALMEYFKGTCVERVTMNGNVFLVDVNGVGRRDFQYLRREAEAQRPCLLILENLPIMSLQKAPERLTFHEKVLTRSPQLREIYNNLQTFMEKYLAGVEIDHDDRRIFNAY